MAKTKKEVVEPTTKKEVQEVTQPKVDNEVGKIKVKKPKMKKIKSNPDEVTKIDLSKPPKKEEEIVKVDLTKKEEVVDTISEEQNSTVEEVTEEITQKQNDVEKEQTPVVEEITDVKAEEEIKKEVANTAKEIEKAIDTAQSSGEPLPENVQKLMEFMEETGGDLEDYVKLNRDTSKLDDQDVLYEYYKKTKPHLNAEEINFIMNDEFQYNEEEDEEITIKRKKLALKEQVASARAYLDGQKSKYYKEIKAGSKLTDEQQKAIDFFNRYNEESEESNKAAEKQKSTFIQKTNEVFNDKFKGFEYSVGDKKFRFNVKDVNQTKDSQSDLSNFVGKFLDEQQTMKDARGYHKGLFTAMNADAVAQHFYEQGKADAVKESVVRDKNINVDPRQAHSEVEAGGIKVRVLGDNSSDFKFKIKNNK
jgi:hypothetical protein